MTDQYFADIEDMNRNLLIGEIMRLNKRISRLEDQLSEQSWRENPDRMGGQFTDTERNRRNEWR